jgi:hypothetical protein
MKMTCFIDGKKALDVFIHVVYSEIVSLNP